MRPNEREMIEILRSAGARYEPLRIVSMEMASRQSSDLGADAIIRCQIADGPSFRVLVEVVSRATPKVIRSKCAQMRGLLRDDGDGDTVRLLVAPYIAEQQAAVLAEAGLSWLDLSGNMVIRVGERIYIERTGKPNRFPDTAPIKKIFEGTASLVGRALLLEPTGFVSLTEMVKFIKRRGGTITLPTVSKVLSALEEDLLVAKSREAIRVLEPGRLLDKLAEGYAASREKLAGTTSRLALDDADRAVKVLCTSSRSVCLVCGFYAAQIKGLAGSSQITMWVRDMRRFREVTDALRVNIQRDEEFGNLTVIEARSPLPWFNATTANDLPIVDDLQLYLEMTVDTPRGPKVAQALRPRILGESRDG